VVILTCNEAHHLPGCLAALPPGLPVVVVDSGSHDETLAIARAHGCRVASHPWEGFAAQRNFAMESCSIETPWVLFVDADEVYPSAFFEWFLREVADDPAVDAVIAPSRLFLRERRLDHAPGYPIYHPRVIRRGRLRFLTNHTGHGESIPADTVTRIAPIPYDHHFYHGEIIAWMHKHIGKASMEVALKPTSGAKLTRRGRLSLLFGRSWLRIPARFAYHYLLRGGFRDGRAGLEFALMFAWYEATIYLQRIANRANQDAAHI
jgi:glycosyltransferase involved in cell wall biosynthesis